ncbi:MAG TPA: 3-methyladenine DNA glycosylase [Candidatus Corynebacterium avicola]|uniref:3-methyladenine DNA glycosylase n=1 Tax=Candidatus Corynebacterium avicola TaxID=2838527 RepID=A0A9D1RST5_9CORY|nr:3-methyladenine DNA glycosylase [Candidatus Corynebacterium avicola]
MLGSEQWRAEQRAHVEAVDALTAGHRARRAAGERHPVWDFMFTYYPVRPGALRKWSPGSGVALALDDTALPEGLNGSSYFRVGHQADSGATVAQLDTEAYAAARGRGIRHIHRLLTATASRPAQMNCFGMHEWAMVYRDTPRHPEPLRLGRSATDEVVEASRLRCTHFDAFRFFTSPAATRNSLVPTRESQVDLEQPGCLHATMDLYKWASKLGPLIPGDLWLETFRLACDVRKTDMEASPYDLSEWGFTPVQVETPAGRAEYVRRQRDFTDRGGRLRGRIISLLEDCYPELQRHRSTPAKETADGTTLSR